MNLELLLFIRIVRPQLAMPFPPAQSYGFRDFSPTKIISSAVIILEEEVRRPAAKMTGKESYRREWGVLCEAV